MDKTKKIIFFPNGVTAVFDEHGNQVPELQRSSIKLFLEFLEDHDEDPLEFEYTMPDNQKAKVIETESGYDWTFSKGDEHAER